MKLTVPKKDLLRAATIAAGAVDDKPSIPILGNLRLDASNASLAMHGTDMMIGTSVSISADVSKPGSLLVPAKAFVNAIKGLADGDVSVSLDDSRVELKSGKSKQRIAHSSALEFPVLASAKDASLAMVSANVLRECIGRVAHAASTDDSKPHLAGVQVDIGKRICRAVASNGHTLALRELPCEADDLSVLIPRKGVGEVRRLLDGAKDRDVAIGLGGGMLFVVDGATTVSVKLTGDAFPPYEAGLKYSDKHRAVVSRESLLDSIKRVMSALSDSTVAFEMRISDGQIALRTEHTNGDASDVVECDYSGDGITVGVRGAYAILALSALDSDEIAVQLGTELHPVLFVPATSKDAVQLVMPSRI